MLLLDTSFSYALQDTKDKYHHLATRFMWGNDTPSFIPDVTLTEMAQLLGRASRVNQFIQTVLQPPSQLVHIEPPDLVRVSELLITYSDSRLDFVDLCLVAIAERLNITDICTFDRRDFTIVRPRHAETLTLLP